MTVSLEDFWNGLPQAVSTSNRAVVAEFLDDHRRLWPDVEAEADADRQHLLRRALAIAGKLATDDPNKLQNEEAAKMTAAEHARVVRERTDKIADLLRSHTEDDRKKMLDDALRAVGSTITVS
jgi:hypothetical protein